MDTQRAMRDAVIGNWLEGLDKQMSDAFSGLKENPNVDISFRQDKRKPVKTVAALIKELQQLPPRMKISIGLADTVKVLVTNYGGRYFACCIDEFDEDDQ